MTKKDPHKTAFDARRATMKKIEKEAGRRADKALFVMLEADEKERYEQLAEELNVSMRDLVRLALNKVYNVRNQIAHSAAQGIVQQYGGVAGISTITGPIDNPVAATATIPDDAQREAFGTDPLRQALAQIQRIARLEERVAQLEDRTRELAYKPVRPTRED